MKIKTLYVSCIAVIFGCICGLVMLLLSPLSVSAASTFNNYLDGYITSVSAPDALKAWADSNTTGFYFVSDNGSSDSNHAVVVSYIVECELNITKSSTSVNISSSPATQFRVYNMYYNGSIWYSNGGSGSYNSGNFSRAEVNIIASSLKYNYNGVLYDPAPPVPDSFYCAKDGYNINFGVYCNEYSTLIHDSNLGNVSYFTTDLYWVQFSISYDNSTIIAQPNAYMYNKFNMSLHPASEVYDESTGESLPLMYYYASANWQSWARGICAKESTIYSLSAPLESSITEISQGKQFPSQNSISLNMLLNAYLSDAPDIDMSDLFTEITVDFVRVSDHKKVYSAIIDYSSLDPNTVVPADDGNEPDPFDTLTNVIQNFNNYFEQLFKGDIFIPPTAKLNYEGLYDISIPDYDISTYELDAAPIAFFGSFVEWWFSTPFGLIAMAALTFLVIRTILW